MNPAEKHGSRVDWLVRERWIVEESLTSLKAAARKLLCAHAGLDRIRAIALALRTNLKIKDQLEKQLAESHCTVEFVYPL
ncbi:MAG: hypothetical protein DMG32_25275 [Acidobacteria bacterium]|nr:MAG: hypothetical protein DMG32_25275 [Acidobacteriota bacterium]